MVLYIGGPLATNNVARYEHRYKISQYLQIRVI